ncbi:MAG: hypothetical protein AABY10_04705 [Nanoarchaeota archaeon]
MTKETKYYLIKGIKSRKEYTLMIEGDSLLINTALRGIDQNVYEITPVNHKSFCKNIEKKAFEMEIIKK